MWLHVAAGGTPKGVELQMTLPTDSPASFEQEHAWITDHLSAGDPPQVYVRTVRLQGAIDEEQLAHATAMVAAARPLLRTRLEDRPTGLRQIIVDSIETPLERIDLIGSDIAEAKLRAVVFARLPLDPEGSPCWRLLLIKLAVEDHLLVSAMHTALCDGVASHYAFLSDLIRAYHGDALAPDAMSYASYARQQRRIDVTKLEQQRAYWLARLAEAPLRTELPRFGIRQPVRIHGVGELHRILPPRAWQSVSAGGDAIGVGKRATLLGALLGILHRYTGQEQLLVGVHLSGRQHFEVARSIGNFGTLAALRADLDDCTDVAGLFTQVESRLQEAETHKDLPFQQVLTALHCSQDASTTPLFQIMVDIDLETPNISQLSQGDLRIAAADIPVIKSVYDLELAVRPSDRGLSLHWTYNPHVYSGVLVEQFARHFEQFLHTAANQPDSPVAQLDYFTVEDQAAISRYWNAQRVPYRKASVQTFIDEQARLTPYTTAVEFGDMRLPYAELVRQSNQLANQLRARGVQHGQRVGLYP